MKDGYITYIVLISVTILWFGIILSKYEIITYHLGANQNYGCGPKALATLCRFAGIETSPKKLSIVADPDKDGITSMYDLVCAVEATGLKAKGYSITLDKLKMRNLPVIAHIRGNHFVVVVSYNDDLITIIDNDSKLFYKDVDFADI